ncbi:inositol monophosphatase family protein [Salinirussus salinus]|uniref:inositol monophosphatase family protein n=1 Tax=Salinirussus salinus TaxID=1198300 RepID=UPI00135CD1AC|nr:inositol monophosphatase [Salinirussus salinus]
MDETHRAAVAERAARAGGVVAREMFRQEIAVETKTDKSDVVTVADRDAQQQAVATVRQEFPEDPFLCEEEVAVVGGVDRRDSVPTTGPVWVVDPIDGTANYVRGLRYWATVVAALVDGDPVGVATYLPAQDDIYTAGPESTTKNGEPLRVSDRSDPGTFALGAVGRWPREDGGASLDDLGSRFGDVRRVGSMQATLALVAAGSLEGAVATGTPHPWDSVAGAELVRRAGGTVTDLRGEPWTHDSTGLVASNGRAHERLLDAVSEPDGD